MAQRRGTAQRSTRKTGDRAAPWRKLTWDDLSDWAGDRSVSRGRGYQRQGRVTDLAVDCEGRLLATVQGTRRYVVRVGLRQEGRMSAPASICTCPVGADGCKHAVAVVAAFLEALADDETVPDADPDDPRWDAIQNTYAGDDDDYFEDEIEDMDNLDDADSRVRTRSSPVSRKRGKQEQAIASHVRAMPHEELVDLVLSLTTRFPDLREEFLERIALTAGDVDRLVKDTRRELREVTSEIGWRNSWDNDGFTPDYSRLRHKLERLVERGYCDQVVALGKDLIRAGMEQVEQSHDEGETASAVSDCLPVVFAALKQCDRPAPEKILFAIDAHLEDDYDVIGDAADVVLNAKWKRGDWSVVADRLAKRLKGMPRPSDKSEFMRCYQRDRVSGWLLEALTHAGRGDELLAVYEDEARVTGSYERLVRHLLGEGKLDQVECWAREGIEKTRQDKPGIAVTLIGLLGDLARRRRQWDIVAAHAAADFFTHPHADGLDQLLKAAAKAKCVRQVRTMAMAFLEAGTPPMCWSRDRQSQWRVKTDPAWPLPVPDYLAPGTRSAAATPHKPQPHYDVLLDMAIKDKRPDEALRWYDKMTAGAKRSSSPYDGWGTGGTTAHDADRVAAAVADTHPERALEIYRHGLEAHLPHANSTAYEACARCLRNMRPICQSLGREEQWHRWVADIRSEYKRRPRFMEILDRLDGRTIVQQARQGRR